MADGTLPLPPDIDIADGASIMVVLGGERYLMPLTAVEAIVPPPALSRVPHSPPLLLGAGNLGGQVLPVVDLAKMLPGGRQRRYDGGGDVLRVRVTGGSVGVWVDRVERLLKGDMKAAEATITIDPAELIEAGMVAPELASDNRHPLGDAREIVDRPPAVVSDTGYILVEAAGKNILLARQAVLELTEPPPWVPVPGAPQGFYGVGILRGDAMPLLSLASLLDLPESGPLGCFAVTALAGHRLLLGFDRVAGLRTQEHMRGRRRNERVFNLATSISAELRRIVSDFAPSQALAQSDFSERGSRQFLSFVAGKQSYALPVDAVDRVVPPQPLVALPRLSHEQSQIAGAIELRGQVVPVASIEASAGEVGAYVIMRAETGPMAIGVERVERLVTLRPEQTTPARGGDALIDSVGVLGDDRDVLRILAPDRVGGEG
jgi:purine-binding chemotaxis protein CheW